MKTQQKQQIEYNLEIYNKIKESVSSNFFRIRSLVQNPSFQDQLVKEQREILQVSFNECESDVNSFFEKDDPKSPIYISPDKFKEIEAFFKGDEWKELYKLTSASALLKLATYLLDTLKSYQPKVEHLFNLLATEVNIYNAFLAQFKQLIDEISGDVTFCTAGAELSLLIPNIETILTKINLNEDFVTDLIEKITNLLTTIDLCNQCYEELGKIEFIVLRAYQQSIGIALKLQTI